jgi:hypothetical protein
VVQHFRARPQSDRYGGQCRNQHRAGSGAVESGPRDDYFQIKERLKLQFRAGLFNMPNHTVLGSSNTTFTNGNFGKIFGIQTAPRVGEMGPKLLF